VNRAVQILLTRVVLLGGFACGIAWAQDQPQASRTFTEYHDATGAQNPAHVTDAQWQDDRRTVETRIVEVPSINGGYEPISETERETLRIDANTVRIVQRWFSSWAGQRQPFQVTEEERRTEPGGRENVVRTTSTLDVSGHWQVQETDIEETVSTAPGTRETRKTVLGIIAGDLVPVQQLEETEHRNGNLVEVQRKLLAPNATGHGQVSEVQETLVMQTNNGQTTEEKTYSTYVPNTDSDGQLHLVQQRNVSATTAPDGSTRTEQQVQQVNPGDPRDGLITTTLVIGISQPLGRLRSETSEEVRVLDVNGNFPVVWVTDSQGTKEIR